MLKLITLFGGAMPPPVGGQSKINEQIAEALRSRCQLIVLDLSPGRLDRSLGYHLQRFAKLFSALLRVIRYAGRARRLYLSTDSGLGLVYSVILAGTARLVGYSLYLHYHSFSFIERRSKLAAALVTVSGSRATHVFLCERMKELFERNYAFGGPYLICSNAPLVPSPAQAVPREWFGDGASGGLRIGLLSHLFPEKGLNEFISLLRLARGQGVPVRGILAGPPVSAADAATINAAQNELGDRLDFRGPVYGRSKQRFFADTDVFVFPTRYRVEAQPLVLFEALSYGIPVISYDRGCISSDLGTNGAVLIPPDAEFEPEALRVLSEWIEAPDQYTRARQDAARLGRDLQEKGVSGLDRLLTALSR
jgi:glycosyltransferase involved in cell wall biosynthesis